MRLNSVDATIKRNYIQKYRFLISEYEQVKAQEHSGYRFVHEFYRAHHLDRRVFLKYYSRYKQSGKPEDLLPRKRGPRWKTRRFIPYIEQKVIEQRYQGLNRYEIYYVLKERLKNNTPSPSGIYQILRRHKLNRLRPKMKETRREIIKERAGQLGHVDTHYLSKDLILNDRKRRYLVCVIDAYTRIAWAEVVDDIKALTVMFSMLRMFNIINVNYGIQFEEIISDNGPEFGPKGSQVKAEHPFERMLIELGVKHRYTRPYRPQTNGKVERLWRTFNYDLIEETTFENIDEFKTELEQYLYYYNNERPHQALDGKTPVVFAQNCLRNT